MKTYGIDDAKVIIRDFLENWVEFKSDGVHLNSEMLQYDTSQVLHWKYVCELENPDAPNPLTAPALPFPFTANELTAYMLDGLGACITSIYGNWEDGPDQAMLDSMGVLGREPRRAITDAYGAFKAAQATVGSYPAELQKRANCLCKTYSYQEDEANEREGVFADGVTPDEANARRARATASNAALKRLYSLAKKEYQAAFGAWRKAMVCQLLQPAPAQTPATPAWSLITSLARSPGYRWPLYQFLKAAHAAGKPCPKAREVLEGWKSNTPPELEVMTDGVKYSDAQGSTKEADLKAIQQSIKGLLKK